MSRQRVLNHMLMDLVNTSALRATGLNANFPLSGSGMELYASGAPATSVIQSYDRDASAWRDLVLNAGNITLTPQATNGKLFIGAAANGPFLRRLGSESLGVEAPNQYLMLMSKNATHVGGNCYWDGSQWLRYDTAQPACVVISGPSNVQFYTAPAGTGAIGWTAAATLQQSTGILHGGAPWTTVTYQNGFSAQTAWGPVQYMRTSDGTVRFRGLLMSPASGWGHGIPAFTLPAGFRLGMEPGGQNYHHFGTLSDSALLGGITIASNGVFSPWMASSQASTGVHWWDLAGISYMSESLG